MKRGHEQHADQRHAADQLDVDHADACGSPAACCAGPAPPAPPAGRRGRSTAWPASASAAGRPSGRCAPASGRARRRPSARRRRASTATHSSASQGFQNQRTQLATSAATISDGGDHGPPLLLERVAAEEDDAVLLGDHAPAGAGAARRLAGVGVGARRRRAARPQSASAGQQVQRQRRPAARWSAPLVQSPNRLRCSQGTTPSVRDRRRARRDRAEGVGHGASQRSLMADALVVPVHQRRGAERGASGRPAMMMAMHSTARPVWLSVVLAIETTSG